MCMMMLRQFTPHFDPRQGHLLANVTPTRFPRIRGSSEGTSWFNSDKVNPKGTHPFGTGNGGKIAHTHASPARKG